MLKVIMSKSGGKDTTADKKWVSYFDFLRVLAAMAVVLIHVSCKGWVKIQIGSLGWWGATFWDGATRWAVPIFVMISGALMLNPEKKFSVKKLYSKNILRMVIIFAVWSILYILFSIFVLKNDFKGFVDVIKNFFGGYYHMWFIYMLIGLYIITPVLRVIVRRQTVMEYFLIVGILLSIILPGIKSLCDGYLLVEGNKIVGLVSSAIGSVTGSLGFKFAAGYVLYYVLGYWLSKIDIPKAIRCICYVLGICGLILTVLYTGRVTILSQRLWGIFESATPWVLAQAAALFIFARYHCERIGRNKIVKKISFLSLGIYLIHAGVIEFLLLYVCPDIKYNFVNILIMSGIVFAISALLTWIIKKIPLVKNIV